MEFSLKDKKILVVDDTIFLRVEIVKMLIELGASRDNIVQSGDGLEALGHIKNPLIKFDVILSDWNMPNMNGLQLLKQVRAAANTSVGATPFLLITTVSEKDKVLDAIKFKVNGYIIKPVTSQALEANLKRVLFGEDDDE